MTAPADSPAGLPVSRTAKPSVGLLAEAVARLVRGYQYAVSPILAPHCRYWPSCSEYAIDALRTHGFGRGGLLALGRLCRCHPWAAGGVDPVPPRRCADSASPGGPDGSSDSRSSYARRAASPVARPPDT